jgi:hypothetical protein
MLGTSKNVRIRRVSDVAVWFRTIVTKNARRLSAKCRNVDFSRTSNARAFTPQLTVPSCKDSESSEIADVSCGSRTSGDHSEDHAEPCFALHHASVSISSLFERNCLDHRADILQNAEGKGVLAIDRRAGQ